jgi:hypothetical protein
LSILPAETNYATLKIIREAENELGLTESEVKNLGVMTSDKQITWDNEKEKKYGDRDFKLSNATTAMIMNALKKKDEENKLTKDLFSLCEKFL